MTELRILISGRTLIKEVYNIYYPQDEKFGLQSQIRRAVVSVNLNITEGNNRQTKKDFLRFLYIAKGSLYEVKECLIISKELEFINNLQKDLILNDYFLPVIKQLNSLIRFIGKNNQSPKSNIQNLANQNEVKPSGD